MNFKNQLLRLFSLCLMVIGMALQSNAQGDFTSDNQLSEDGNVSISFNHQEIIPEFLKESLAMRLGLGEHVSFKEFHRDTDKYQLIHISYQQYIKDVKVQDAIVVMHIKGNYVRSLTGLAFPVMEQSEEAQHSISIQEAINIAKEYTGVRETIEEYEPEFVWFGDRAIALEEGNLKLAISVRIDGYTQDGSMVMSKVFMNSENGEIIDVLPLIAHADVKGTGETLFRGKRNITVDSFALDSIPRYRLRDRARNIHTYNAGGVDPARRGSSPYSKDVDYENDLKDWTAPKTFQSYTVDSLTNSSFLSGIGQTHALVSGAGYGSVEQTDNLATMNILYLYRTPLNIKGLFMPVNDDTLFGFLGKINANYNVVDSLHFYVEDTTVGTHNWIDDKSNRGTYTIENKANPAIDIHWGNEVAFDFYETLGRSSYNNRLGRTRSYVNGTVLLAGTQQNAMALPNPYNSTVFGMGNGVTGNPYVALDVVGHEFTHMVTNYNNYGGLNYQNESGALNEAFSDMMATAMEFFVDSSTANWTIGEEVILYDPLYMRSMEEPNGPNTNVSYTRQPNTYKGRFWYTGTQDNGGVHINSGVANKWFYLLSMGGNATNDNRYTYNLEGVGVTKAAEIAYQIFISYLNPRATYVDAYKGSLKAMEDAYGANSPEYETVKKTWWAVGVPHKDSVDNPVDTGNNKISTRIADDQLLNVFPNPASDFINIHSDWAETINAIIFDAAGRNVKTITIRSGKNKVNIADLNKGVYIIKYENNNQRFYKKLTIL